MPQRRELFKSLQNVHLNSQRTVMWDTELLLYCDSLSSSNNKDNSGHPHVEKITVSCITFYYIELYKETYF